jgi:hypothetical protein
MSTEPDEPRAAGVEQSAFALWIDRMCAQVQS